ncbi:YDG/SRA domain-containing protein [Arabidopsis lyrata subsp. lyrata]|uniref:YDG/SRA domain-containing protein n=1 Tax=Arabidopsis lyrata subsp. lyrata TaxID=81972 RepID=D7MPX2_ARALL|nr:YDG/SRA domain-containing protein [Arabidopsis lyrata subsp. lyrata]
MSDTKKRSLVFAIRDFPPGCGTHIDVSPRFNLPADKSFKNQRTGDVSGEKNLSFAAPKPEGTCLKRESADHEDHIDHIVAAPEPNAKRELADQDHVVAATTVPYATSSHRQELEIRNSDCDPTPREKVLEVLSLFKQVYSQLDRDKKARRCGDFLDATSRIDLKTLTVLENMGKQVNTEKRIGSVPGVEVGDVFQYKTELRLVGLHSKTMCGIDYLKIGDDRLATSIVASEGYGYNDTFKSGVMIYTGEGGNVISKDKKTEDQKLVKGNLALATSMRQKKQVRVIRGEERWDHKGKRYVYDGLYMVEEYWPEREVRGKTVYKFKLCRIPGQPPLT